MTSSLTPLPPPALELQMCKRRGLDPFLGHSTGLNLTSSDVAAEDQHLQLGMLPITMLGFGKTEDCSA